MSAELVIGGLALIGLVATARIVLEALTAVPPDHGEHD